MSKAWRDMIHRDCTAQRRVKELEAAEGLTKAEAEEFLGLRCGSGLPRTVGGRTVPVHLDDEEDD